MKRILLIEDNETTQFLVKRSLKNHIVECLEGLQGVEDSINSNRPDLVVLDYRLKDGATGIEILKLIQIIDKTIKVIVISSSSNEIIKECFANGAYDCSYKGDLVNYLPDIVRNLD